MAAWKSTSDFGFHGNNVASMAWGARNLIPTQVGGEYDNGERFDLRLPYVDQGYVLTRRPSFGAARTRRWGGGVASRRRVHLAQEDPDADVMGKLMDMFKKKPPKEEE